MSFLYFQRSRAKIVSEFPKSSAASSVIFSHQRPLRRSFAKSAPVSISERPNLDGFEQQPDQIAQSESINEEHAPGLKSKWQWHDGLRPRPQAPKWHWRNNMPTSSPVDISARRPLLHFLPVETTNINSCWTFGNYS